MANYEKLWSSDTPGLLIFMIDQSGSMEKTWDGNNTKKDQVAKAINRVISEMVAANTLGETIKDRVHICLIGYGGTDSEPTKVFVHKNASLSEYADNPIRIEKNRKKVNDENGGLVDVDVETPIFLEPAAGGLTPMGDAFKFVKDEILTDFLTNNPDDPAPVIINVSDGLPFNANESKPEEEKEKAVKEAKEIMDLSSSDGNVLIFNVHIGEGSKVSFPISESELSNDEAKFLFEISSKLPDTYIAAGQQQQLPVKQNSKAFIANADSVDLIKFISFGSKKGGVKDLGA